MASRSTRLPTATDAVARTVLILLMSTVTPSSFAVDDRSATATDEIVDRVVAEQAANGPYSEELIGLLRSLAVMYEEDGLYALSAAMRERAMQIVRANHGLRSFDQAEFLEQRIATEEARGNFTDAWALEESLLELVAANPDDLRTVPVLREIAAKRMTTAERYAAGEFPPQILLGCYYNPTRNPEFGSCSAGSKSGALGALLADARRHYRAAIDVLVRHGQATSDEVRDLEMAIVRDSYRYGTYGPGRYALHRLFDYDAASSAPLLAQADAALRVADWDLAFGLHPVALDIYEHLYRQLVAREVAHAEIERRFGAGRPILVPTSERDPFDPETANPKGSYIDVAFEITKFGRGKRPRVLDSSHDVRAADVEAMQALIVNSRFRPAMIDGEFVTRSVTARWYVAGDGWQPRKRVTLLRP